MTNLLLFDAPPKPTGNRAAVLACILECDANGYAVTGARLAELSDDWRGDVKKLIAEGHGILERQVGCGWLLSMRSELLK